jgi:hypothetical protein
MRCQHNAVSLRAVATMAICQPRRAATRRWNALKEPGAFDAANAALTSIRKLVRSRSWWSARAQRASCRPAYARVQPEIRDQSVWILEPGEVTHRRDNRRAAGDVDRWHRHQSCHDRVIDNSDSDVVINEALLVGAEVDLTDEGVDASLLIGRCVCALSQRRPILENMSRAGTSAPSCATRSRAPDVQPCPLTHEMRATTDQATTTFVSVHRNPGLGPEIRRKS